MSDHPSSSSTQKPHFWELSIRFFTKAWLSHFWAIKNVNRSLTWTWNPPSPLVAVSSISYSHPPQLYLSLLEANVIEWILSLVFQGPLFCSQEKLSETEKFSRPVNPQQIHCPHFKMTTASKVKAFLLKNSFTMSIDIKDANWHVPMKLFFHH